MGLEDRDWWREAQKERARKENNLSRPRQATREPSANGDLPGRVVFDVPITIGPVDVSGVKVGVGFVGHAVGDALLGQSFLSKFEIILSKEQMILRKR